MKAYTNKLNSNTSHVIVKRVEIAGSVATGIYSNTSHVIVKPGAGRSTRM